MRSFCEVIFWTLDLMSSICCQAVSTSLQQKTRNSTFSSGTDEVWAKREPSLCNESVNGHFWSNLCLNCIFKWTWFVKTEIWSVIDGSRVRFPVAAALITFLFLPVFSLFWLDSRSVPLAFPKLANAQPSNFGPLPPLRIFSGNYTCHLRFWKDTVIVPIHLSVMVYSKKVHRVGPIWKNLDQKT